MKSTTTTTGNTNTGCGCALPTCTFEEIESPGAYLEVETGRLFRLTSDSLLPGHSPVFSIVRRETNTYVRLSEDPTIPISKARMIASNNDCWPNF